jgi:hypothetical protein
VLHYSLILVSCSSTDFLDNYGLCYRLMKDPHLAEQKPQFPENLYLEHLIGQKDTGINHFCGIFFDNFYLGSS